jgi:CRP-like cAMP-binding protein
VITGRFLLGRARDAMSPDDERILEDAVSEVRELPPRFTLVRTGEEVRNSTLLVEGYMCRYMDDREGYRQLVAIHVPGDFVDLHGYALKRLDHDVATLGPVKIATVPHEAVTHIVEEHPNLTRLLWLATLLDAAMHRQWIFRLGRLDTLGRMAHLFCELDARLAMVGLADEGRFALPLTQPDLAEACGVTGVHANRTLRALRERELMTFRDGEVAISDLAGLRRAAEFDPAYLYANVAGMVGTIKP